MRNLTPTGFVSVQAKQENHSDGLTLNFTNGMSLSGIDEHNLASLSNERGFYHDYGDAPEYRFNAGVLLSTRN